MHDSRSIRRSDSEWLSDHCLFRGGEIPSPGPPRRSVTRLLSRQWLRMPDTSDCPPIRHRWKRSLATAPSFVQSSEAAQVESNASLVRDEPGPDEVAGSELERGISDDLNEYHIIYYLN